MHSSGEKGMQNIHFAFLSKKTFFTTERIRLLFQAAIATLLALLFIAMAILVLLHRPTPQYNWRTAAILGAIGLCFLMIGIIASGASYTHIVISPIGIELHGFGILVCSPWENVGRIGVIPQTLYPYSPDQRQQAQAASNSGLDRSSRKLGDIVPESHLEGLVLKESVPQLKKWWRFSRHKQTWFISFSLFRWWRYSEIGRLMRQFAPELFED